MRAKAAKLWLRHCWGAAPVEDEPGLERQELGDSQRAKGSGELRRAAMDGRSSTKDQAPVPAATGGHARAHEWAKHACSSSVAIGPGHLVADRQGPSLVAGSPQSFTHPPPGSWLSPLAGRRLGAEPALGDDGAQQHARAPAASRTSASSCSSQTSSCRPSLEAMIGALIIASSPARAEAGKGNLSIRHPVSTSSHVSLARQSLSGGYSGTSATVATSDALSSVLSNLPPLQAPNPHRFRRARTALLRSTQQRRWPAAAARHSHAAHRPSILAAPAPHGAGRHTPVAQDNPYLHQRSAMPCLQLSQLSWPEGDAQGLELCSGLFARWDWGAQSSLATPGGALNDSPAACWPWVHVPLASAQATAPPSAPCTSDAWLLAAAGALRTATGLSLSAWASLTALQGQSEATDNLAHSFQHLVGREGADGDSNSDEPGNTDSSGSGSHVFGAPSFVFDTLLDAGGSVTRGGVGTTTEHLVPGPRWRRRGTLGVVEDTTEAAAFLACMSTPTRTDSDGSSMHSSSSTTSSGTLPPMVARSCSLCQPVAQQLGSSWGSSMSLAAV